MHGLDHESYRMRTPEQRDVDLSHVHSTVWAQQLELPPYLARSAGALLPGWTTAEYGARTHISLTTARAYIKARQHRFSGN